jgi:hypothetical protein
VIVSAGVNGWVLEGTGKSPAIGWTVATDAPLVGLEQAAETGDLIAADETGTLYKIDRSGRIVNMVRGRSPVRGLAWADTGAGGAVLVGQNMLYWFNEQLQFTGSAELPGLTMSVAIESQANYVAVALGDSINVLFDSNRKLFRHFDSHQPLVRLRFLLDEPALVGVAEYGLLTAHHFDGSKLWSEKLFSGVGDLAITGDGRAILLACFAMGIQCHGGGGEHRGSYHIGGTASRVATSFHPGRIAVATLERMIYWLDTDGQVLWQGLTPDEVVRVVVDPLGKGLTCGFKSGRITRLDWLDRPPQKAP